MSNDPTTRKLIPVLICVKAELAREGIMAVLTREPDMLVAGTAEEGNAAISLTATLEPSVVLLDLSLEKPSGLHVARQLQTCMPITRTVVLAGSEDAGQLPKLLSMGMASCLPRLPSAAELVAAIRAVALGEIILSSEAARLALNFERASLTNRETEVLKLLVQGFRNRQISDLLSVSLRTVELHVTHIYQKLGVETRTTAVLKARELGLVYDS